MEELGGLIFAYLGPLPAPLLPRWSLLVAQNVVRDIAFSVLPCNWLQAQENSYDPIHASWMHGYYGDYLKQRNRAMWPQGVEPSRGHARKPYAKIAFEKFEYGVVKRILPQMAKDPDFVAMFVDEARVCARLAHPNIVEIFGIVEDGKDVYLRDIWPSNQEVAKFIAENRAFAARVAKETGMQPQ